MSEPHGPAQRRTLTDILAGSSAEALKRQWTETEAAEEFKVLPRGVYVARIIGGELAKARSGTPGYKLTFKILEGEHAGRRFWHDIWLTESALPMAKRDLGKLGVRTLDQLETPLPQGIRCQVRLAVRRDDDGVESNRVRSFEVLGIDELERDAFAPAEVPGDASFAFGANIEGDKP